CRGTLRGPRRVHSQARRLLHAVGECFSAKEARPEVSLCLALRCQSPAHAGSGCDREPGTYKTYKTGRINVRKVTRFVVFLLVALPLLWAQRTAAQGVAGQYYPRVELSGSYSFVRQGVNIRDLHEGTNLYGGSAALAFNPLKHVGLVGDVGGYKVSFRG